MIAIALVGISILLGAWYSLKRWEKRIRRSSTKIRQRTKEIMKELAEIEEKKAFGMALRKLREKEMLIYIV